MGRLQGGSSSSLFLLIALPLLYPSERGAALSCVPGDSAWFCHPHSCTLPTLGPFQKESFSVLTRSVFPLT